jgi:hypothetical protein
MVLVTDLLQQITDILPLYILPLYILPRQQGR